MNHERIGNYAEVKIGGRRRFVEIVRESDGCISGYRANLDGSRWDRDDGKTWTQEMIIASTQSVIRRMQLDLVCGQLVESK